MYRLSNRIVIALAAMVVLVMIFFAGGYSPPSWEGRTRLQVSGEPRDTFATHLEGEKWEISCFEDRVPCDLRAEAVCGGAFTIASETTRARNQKEKISRWQIWLRPGVKSDGKPIFVHVIECNI